MDKHGIYPSGMKPLAGQRVEARAVDAGDGHRVDISVPHAYWEQWIDDAGNWGPIALGSNRHPDGITPEDKASINIARGNCIALGWVHYDTGYDRLMRFATSMTQAGTYREFDAKGFPVPGTEVPWLGGGREKYIAKLQDVQRARTRAAADKNERDDETLKQSLSDFVGAVKEGMAAPRAGGRQRNPGMDP